MRELVLGEMMGVFASALSRPDLAAAETQKALTAGDYISSIFSVRLSDLSWFAAVQLLRMDLPALGCLCVQAARAAALLYSLLTLGRVQDYIQHLCKLLDNGAWDSTSPAGQQLASILALKVHFCVCYRPLPETLQPASGGCPCS